MEVERIAVSTLVKTGCKVAAAFFGSFVFSFVIFVVALFTQGGLAAAFVGPLSGSSAAGFAFGAIPLALFAGGICWPAMGLYLYVLFERMESHADLGTAGRTTLACVGSLVVSCAIFITVVAGLYSEDLPTHTADVVLRYPLAFCAFWSMLAVFFFRGLKSREA